jgi:cellulose synthase/poly-beta-1,6-N-acetylglucosamine synthase-like glycosyltransferase
MFQNIVDFFQGFVFVYSVCLLLIYTFLALSSIVGITTHRKKSKGFSLNNLLSSPLSPGISVIAPAYNEGLTIIANVVALLTLEYPLFEVIIINDGSTDDTLEKLVKRFELKETNYLYHEKIKTQPVTSFYRSVNPAYDKLLIINKVNGKSKADASNAGINAASFDYFLCTDVDCILGRDTLTRLIRPFLDEKVKENPFKKAVINNTGYIHQETNRRRVIASGAPLRMINSSDVDDAVIKRFRPPLQLLPRFQELEYIRGYLLAKMGWSGVNCVPNVSGGLGLFDTEVAVKAGGYDHRSFAEDIDLITRMCLYMIETGQKYAVRYVPTSQCWTEGPSTLKVFSRQRTRWARGLVQIISDHRNVIFNVNFKRLGLIVFPYNFIFEFLAPIIEGLGIIFYVYLIAIGAVNWSTTYKLLLFLYSFSIMISSLAVLWDQITTRHYKTTGEVIGLCLTAFLEPFLYHPLVVFFGLKGYIQSLFRKKLVWGNMQRQGFSSAGAKPQSVQIPT